MCVRVREVWVGKRSFTVVGGGGLDERDEKMVVVMCMTAACTRAV